MHCYPQFHFYKYISKNQVKIKIVLYLSKLRFMLLQNGLYPKIPEIELVR